MICNFLDAFSKRLRGLRTQSRVRATRDLAKFNASLVLVLVYGSQRGVHAALVLLLPYACSTLVFPYPHRETAEHRVCPKLQDRPDGDVLSLGQYHTVEAGEETRPARAVEPRGAPHYQLHAPHLIEVLTLFLCHLGALPHGRCHQTSR